MSGSQSNPLFSNNQNPWIMLVVLVLLSLGGVVLIGNILEPRLAGRSLNLSPLVILLSLVFWGKIWGIVGMFLCVPLTVILNIVLANFDSTKSIAIMLSANGKIIKENASLET